MQPLLCQKYRPNTISDLSLDHRLEESLHLIAIEAKLNVLIVGDAGSGKTTVIEILRKSFESKENNDRVMHISSLHDQGISFYRTEVRTFCQTPCIAGKKLLVIDDLDTVSDQSQQVFRNCIDKFSHNVQFIATCSNLYKIIDSLQSRTTLLRLPLPSRTILSKVAKRICDQEGINITKTALLCCST